MLCVATHGLHAMHRLQRVKRERNPHHSPSGARPFPYHVHGRTQQHELGLTRAYPRLHRCFRDVCLCSTSQYAALAPSSRSESLSLQEARPWDSVHAYVHPSPLVYAGRLLMLRSPTRWPLHPVRSCPTRGRCAPLQSAISRCQTYGTLPCCLAT
jgi:hypothetical protein